jgi:hypothetical protein
MARSGWSAELNPDQLKKLADSYVVQAKRIETGAERLGMLTLADALINMAELKELVLEHGRRLFN